MQEADPNEVSLDADYYDLGDDGDDDIMDGEIGDQQIVDDDEELGEFAAPSTRVMPSRTEMFGFG